MATTQKDTQKTSVIIPARFSYLNALVPKTAPGSTKPKFSVSLVIDKKDKATIAKIEAAIKAAQIAGEAKLKGVNPKKWKNPLRDGDEDRENDEVYAGCFFINASSDQKPGFVDKDLQEIIRAEEIYSGMYGKASVNFYAFNTNGNAGIACGLNNLMKTKDGEVLSGRKSAQDDFKDDAVFDDGESDLD